MQRGKNHELTVDWVQVHSWQLPCGAMVGQNEGLSLLLAGSLYTILTVYTVLLVIWSFRSNASGARRQLMTTIQEFHHSYYYRPSYSLLQHLLILVNGIEMAALVLSHNLQWPSEGIREFSRTILLDLASSGDGYTRRTYSVFWIVFTVHGTISAWCFARYLYYCFMKPSPIFISPREIQLASVYIEVLFIPSLKRFLESFHCTLTTEIQLDTRSYLAENANIPCWEGSHTPMGVLGVVGVLYALTTAIYSSGWWSSRNHTHMYAPRYRITVTVLKTMLVVSSMFSSVNLVWMDFVVVCGLTVATVVLQPYKGMSMFVNYFRAGTYSAVLWCAISCLVCRNEPKSSITPIYMLFFGTPTAVFCGFIFSIKYNQVLAPTRPFSASHTHTLPACPCLKTVSSHSTGYIEPSRSWWLTRQPGRF